MQTVDQPLLARAEFGDRPVQPQQNLVQQPLQGVHFANDLPCGQLTQGSTVLRWDRLVE